MRAYLRNKLIMHYIRTESTITIRTDLWDANCLGKKI